MIPLWVSFFLKALKNPKSLIENREKSRLVVPHDC